MRKDVTRILVHVCAKITGEYRKKESFWKGLLQSKGGAFVKVHLP